MTQQFFVSAHRFTFLARERITLPAVAANAFRGALGLALRDTDDYFSPKREKGPSGFADPPRPFVLRAAQLNHRSLQAGDMFSFDLHLFVLDRPSLVTFTSALRDFGVGRGRARLQAIDRLADTGTVARRIWENDEWLTHDDTPIAFDFEQTETEARRVSVEFLTPTELKHQGELVEEPAFPILFARIRDRICALSRFYNGRNLEPDLAGNAAEVMLANFSLVHNEAKRRSSRTGQIHPLGGFTGTAVYEGNLGRFLPWLHAAYWTGVGRQTVWGKGVIRASVIY